MSLGKRITPESVQTSLGLGERGIIDIHRPPTADACPLVLAIHGGGWRNGDRHSHTWVAERLVPRGFAVVTCSYRISTEACFPAAFDDLVRLLVWLRRHSTEHGLRSDCCGLLGGSAGGHLACLLSTRGVFEHGDAMIPIAATVAYCPPVDMRLQYEHDRTHGADMTELFMGGTPEKIPDAYRDASPSEFLHAQVPPLWIGHGDADPLVPIAGTEQFVAHLREMDLAVAYHLARNRGHTMLHRDDGQLVLMEEERIVRFLQQNLEHGGSG